MSPTCDVTRPTDKMVDRASFSATDTPVPLLCLTSLIVSSAISQNAFEDEKPFASVEEFLHRPFLEDNVDYLPFHWKTSHLGEKVFPISSDLFSELWQRIWTVLGAEVVPRPYAMRIQFGASADERGKRTHLPFSPLILPLLQMNQMVVNLKT